MSKQMWAIVKETAAAGLTMKQVPIPAPPGPSEVKIKIRKTAICGTDVHIYNWDEWAARTIKPQMIIGHEYVGEIVEVGSAVSGYKVGELVSGEGHLVCDICRHCRAGRAHLCPETKGVGVNRDGCFAEYLVIPASNLIKCSGAVPEELYPVFDPFGNAVHCALSFPIVGEDVLITGAGPIGIMAAAVAKFGGARNVVVTDVNDYRLGLAAKMGATRVVNPMKEDLRGVMSEMGILGFDIGMEMSGSPVAFNQMVDNMYHGGRITMLGMQAAGTSIDWDKVVFRCLVIKGIYGREMYDTWYKMAAMIEGGLDISPIITHRFDARDFEKGFEAMNSGLSGKIILDWGNL
ncbi:MAG: L-threonine 3-dehydrogenase [Oscillospiraceae bacterium]|nr:L-threonine 3-dehydrogenase [Oscillospiraceae bacterium]